MGGGSRCSWIPRRSGNGRAEMNETEPEITVFYDGACPRCVRDREHYQDFRLELYKLNYLI